MSDHEKVFGVCENKCFVEVLPKADAATKTEVVKRTDIQYKKFTFNGTITAGGTLYSNEVTVDGATPNNIIPLGIKRTDSSPGTWLVTGGDIGGYVDRVNVYNNKIQLRMKNGSANPSTITNQEVYLYYIKR